jgi:hypothetical protein
MSITPEQIKQIALDDDDFGHEMRVGDILENPLASVDARNREIARIWPPEHGATYQDPRLGKTRQFDFRCKIDWGAPSHTKRVLLAIECKNLNPEYPLVICGRPRTPEESWLIFLNRPENEIAQLGKFEGRSSYYPPDEFVGKNILRIKEKAGKLCADNDSEIYDKYSQALASMHDLAFEAAYTAQGATCTAFFALPLVVVPDKSLWFLNYNNRGEPNTPAQIDRCAYYVKHKMNLARPDITLPFVVTHIHFATCKGLSQILTEFLIHSESMWDKIAHPRASVQYRS